MPHNHSTRYLNESDRLPIKPAEGVGQWLSLTGPGGPVEEEAAAVADPYGITNFVNTAWARPITAGGRLLMNAKGGGRLEVLPMIASASGTVAFQLWGFDWVQHDIGGNVVIPETGSRTALGVAYNMKHDDAGGGAPANEFSVTASATQTQQISVSNGVAYRDTTSGITYYECARQVFDLTGLHAFFAYVTTASTNSVNILLLGRVI